jgi:hypothetical protein
MAVSVFIRTIVFFDSLIFETREGVSSPRFMTAWISIKSGVQRFRLIDPFLYSC